MSNRKRSKFKRIIFIVSLCCVGILVYRHAFRNYLLLEPFENQPSWSPDGRQITYVCLRRQRARDRRNGVHFAPYAGYDHSSLQEVCILDLDQNQRRQVTEDSIVHIAPVWSSDGSQIAYLSGPRATKTDIHVVKADDWQSSTNLTHNPESYGKLLWSPTDEYLASTTMGEDLQRRLIVVSLRDQNTLSLAEIPATGDYTWSPDGDFIAFVRGKYPVNNVYTVSVPGGEIKQLTHEPSAWYDDLAWLPDSDHIAYTTYCPGEDPYLDTGKQIRILSLDTLSETILPIPLTRHDVYWSPDRRFLGYAAGQMENKSLRIWDRDKQSLLVYSDLGWIVSLGWSPDSDRLLVTRLDDWNNDEHTEPKLWLLKIETGRLIPLSGWFPWYQQETKIDYVRYDD
jgi:Tol biopolymer transport system component